MDILALGWVSILALFTWSIAMVVWGRNGFQAVETTSLPVLNVLFLVALALLVLVSGGILYLTFVEWQDRRRQERDKRMKR